MERLCFGWKALHRDIEAGEADAGEKKNLVQLSQQRLDELIGRAFAKGARRAAGAQDGTQEPALETGGTGIGDEGAAASDALEDTGDSVDSSTGVEAVAAAVEAVPAGEAGPAADGDNSVRMAQLAEARDTLRLANQRLLEAMVMQQAQDAGLSARGAAAALQMCSFDECMEGGAPSENRVKNRLQGFAASWPEFAVCAPPAPFAAGTGSGSIQQDVLKNALGVL